MESMQEELSPAEVWCSGGPGPFTFGLSGSDHPALAPGPLDPPGGNQGVQEVGSTAPKELEIITVTTMQIPCRCTNSYAYL